MKFTSSTLKLFALYFVTLTFSTALHAQEHTTAPSDNHPSAADHARTVAALTGAPEAQTATQTPAPPPPEVRGVERDIEDVVRLWRLGIRGGVALDPELISFGVQSRIGPFFTRRLTFRPSAEFSWGEVTDMVGVNADVAYHLPLNVPGAQWRAYFGGGPGFNFVHQGFSNTTGSGRDIEFGNFEFDTALNIMAGMEWRSGTFAEVRTSVYAGPAPKLRLVIGHNF